MVTVMSSRSSLTTLRWNPPHAFDGSAKGVDETMGDGDGVGDGVGAVVLALAGGVGEMTNEGEALLLEQALTRSATTAMVRAGSTSATLARYRGAAPEPTGTIHQRLGCFPPRMTGDQSSGISRRVPTGCFASGKTSVSAATHHSIRS